MGAVIDLRKNKVIGPAIEEARAEGREEGAARAGARGLQALRTATLSNLRAAFGPLPRWASDRIRAANEPQLIAWLGKAPTVHRLESLMRPPR